MTITKREDACGIAPARVSTTILSFSEPGACRVVLRRRGDLADGPDNEIVLRSGSADEVAFGPFDDVDVIALWRALGASTGALPGLQCPDGALHWPFRQLGRLRVGDVETSRRRRQAAGRRPRFLVRRKPGRLPRRPLVFRECEIVGGRD